MLEMRRKKEQQRQNNKLTSKFQVSIHDSSILNDEVIKEHKAIKRF
jgi:hypothetical protein